MERTVLAHPPIMRLIRTDFDSFDWYGTKMSARNHGISIAKSQQHVVNSANSGRALDNRIEHRLHVRGRPTNDPEHFGGCRLMLQRLAQFRVTLF
jgi:hypothetical protein